MTRAHRFGAYTRLDALRDHILAGGRGTPQEIAARLGEGFTRQKVQGYLQRLEEEGVAERLAMHKPPRRPDGMPAKPGWIWGRAGDRYCPPSNLTPATVLARLTPLERAWHGGLHP